MKILFAAGEIHPLVKTGGLADVAGSLPRALAALGHDVRLAMPGYRGVAARVGSRPTSPFPLALAGIDAATGLISGTLPGTALPIFLLDAPALYDRDGGPYAAVAGSDYPDNALRFAAFSRAVEALALGRAGVDWVPDVVHCHDWQTGLACALLALQPKRPATVFTIHNLAYQGVFERVDFEMLGLPWSLWSPEGLEFFGHGSFIKGGLAYADWLTTVSPTYANEICTPAFGYDLAGLLQARRHRLRGILNGADTDEWDPATDRHLPHHYSAADLGGKARCKAALCAELGLTSQSAPLLAHVGRLVEQKGLDLLLDVLPELLAQDAQIAVLGSGAAHLEARLRAAAARYPGQVVVRLGYDEALAHRIEAGADLFVMPSRFEPCGLNQIYSLRYGTLPVVRRTGGLADTVIDADHDAAQGTGFVFDEASSTALLSTLTRALAYHGKPAVWQVLMQNAMRQDYSWTRSAEAYAALYAEALGRRG